MVARGALNSLDRREVRRVGKAQYRVEPARPFPPQPLERAGERPSALIDGEAPQPRALFVAHGMGQQIPFQTLDAIAEGLRRADGYRRQQAKLPPAPAPVVRTVTLGDERLQRIELTLLTDAGEREVHVYEAYWAPFTEGQVKLRDVMRFLVTAGCHGIKNGTRPFERWLFGDIHTFLAPIRTVIFLLIALAVVGALAVMNATVVSSAPRVHRLRIRPIGLGAASLGTFQRR
jgi:hypothetical protein